MLPSIFGENLFDDFFGDPFGMMPRGRDPLYGKHAKNLMRTDVRETEDSWTWICRASRRMRSRWS